MQLLYMLNRDENLQVGDLVKLYNEGIWKTYELCIFQMYYLLKIAEYSVKDANNRAARLLPTEEDKKFQPILYTNSCVQSIANHTGFLKVVDKLQINQTVDEDLIRRLYNSFDDNPEYKAYLELEHPEKEHHVKILLELYKFLCNSDVFQELCEDHYNNLQDDESLVVGAIKKALKMTPVEGEFYKDFEPADETVREFGENLLLNVCQEDLALLSHIEPALKNWDADRVAVLDMVMIKMALAELLHFPTIPTKVTLNEFVEISKIYSTDKSKDFINGILDRLMKKLIKDGKITKEGRGLME